MAANICVKCSVDPGTHKLYKGVYRTCIETYMKAIKRGQTSLKSYAGFEKHDSSKIIIKMSSLSAKDNFNNCTTSSNSSNDNNNINNSSVNNKLNASPLKKVSEVVGYIGRMINKNS